jgi:hypothetical protein
MSDDFVRDLELALADAARRRAARRGRRLIVRNPVRWPVPASAVAATAVIVIVAAIALAVMLRDAGPPGDQRPVPPPSGVTLPLPATLPAASCHDLAVRDEPAARRFPDIALLHSPQGEADAIEPPQGNEITWLPIRTFDPAETRRAGQVVVIPTLGVPDERRCGSDRGPGICLVDADRHFRCFTAAQVAGGAAVARTADGSVVGIVPDGIERVTLSAGGKRATADVIANVYEAQLGIPAGIRLHVAPARPGCEHPLAPELLDRVGALSRPDEVGHPLPRAARELLREWGWQLDAVVLDQARFWGGGEDAEFWVVPVVPRSAEPCAPATGACIIAVTSDHRGDGHCLWGEQMRPGTWKLGPLWPDRAVLLGLVADGTTGVQVTIDRHTARVDARDDVVAGVVPFPYRDGAQIDVEPLPRPTVAVLDSTGGDPAAAEAALDAVRDAGYRTADAVAPGVKPYIHSELYWHPGRASSYEAELLARRLGIDRITRIAEPELMSRPVAEADADLVVVVAGRRSS